MRQQSELLGQRLRGAWLQALGATAMNANACNLHQELVNCLAVAFVVYGTVGEASPAPWTLCMLLLQTLAGQSTVLICT